MKIQKHFCLEFVAVAHKLQQLDIVITSDSKNFFLTTVHSIHSS